MDSLIGSTMRSRRGHGARALSGVLTAVLLAGVIAPVAVFAADFGVTLNQASGQSDPTNGSTADFRVVFDNPVSDFTISDVTLAGSAGPTTVSVTEIAPNDGTTYTVSVGGMTSDGTVIASVPANSATDGSDFNLASTSSDNTVTVDTTAPADPSTPDMTAGTDSGSSSSDELTNDDTPTFTGTAEPNSLVELYVDGNPTGVTDTASGGGTWTITAPALSGGPHTVTAKATDAADNTSGASNGLPVTIDTTAPAIPSTPDLDAGSDSNVPTDDTTNDTTPTFSGTSDAGTSITLLRSGSTSIGTGTADGAGDWTIAVSALSDGPHSITATATDAAGNESGPSSALSVSIDATGPTVAITSSVLDPTSTSPFPMTVSFNESVGDFTIGDVANGNGSAGNFAGSGASYTFDLTPGGQGAVTASVPSGAAHDLAGNGNSASNSFSTAYDSVAPSVASITRAEGSPTGSTTVDFTVTFDESVSGVGTDDFSLATTGVSGAAVVGVAGSGTTRTVTVNTGSGDGTIRLDLVDDDSIVDAAGHPIGGLGTGNGNYAAGSSYTIDKSVPTVDSIVRADANPTNASGVDFTITFSRSVTGVNASDFAVTTSGISGATVNTVTGSGATYTVTTGTGTGSGTLRLDVVDNDSIVDSTVGNRLGGTGVGNGDFASGQVYTVDRNAPTVLVSSSAPDPTNTSPIGVTVTFSESVSNFVVGDVSATNATVLNFAGSGTTYTFDLVPSSQGALSASVGAAKANDDAGNSNTASNTLTRTYDSSAPAAPPAPNLDAASDSGTSSTDDLTNATTPSLSGTAEAGSAVELFVDGGATGNTGTATSGSWTIALTGSLADGTHTITAKATDAAGNTSTASPGLTITIDTSAAVLGAPDMDAASDSGTSTSDDTTSDLTPTFNGGGAEPGATVTLLSGGSPVGSTTAGGSGGWTITSSTLAEGAHTMRVRQTDDAGNTSSDSGSLLVDIDTIAPATPSEPDLQAASDSGSSASDDLTNDDTPTFDGTSLEPDGTVIELRSGSTTLGTSTVSSGAWSATASSLGDGVHAVTARAVDAAGNASTASTGLSVTIDTTAPTVTINKKSSQADPTGASPVLFDAVFSESVTGLSLSDITDTGLPGGSSAPTVSGSGTTYTVSVTVSPLAYVGGVEPTVDAGAAVDAAGNPSLASTSTDNHVDFNNNSPVAVDDGLTLPEDSASTTIDVVANDTDADLDSITVTGVGAPAHGTAVIVGNQIEYTPDADYAGSDAFDYAISDGRGGIDAGTVDVTVTSLNDPVIATPDTINAVEGQAALAYDVLANDTTAPDAGETMAISLISPTPNHGTAAISGSQLTYTPAAGYFGADSFGYIVSDGNGSTAGAAVTVAIAADTFKPVVTTPLPVILTGTMGTSSTSVRATWTNSDVGTGVKSAFVQPLSATTPFPFTGAGCTTPTTPSVAVPTSSSTGGSPVRLGDATFHSTAAPLTSQTFSLRIGWYHAFRNGAYDQKNNLSDLKCSKLFRLIKYEQTTSAVKYAGGTWTTRSVSGASGSSTKFATRAGATATLTTTARAIAWVTYMGRSSGSAQVYVDGVLKSTISLYSSSSRVRRIAFATSWATQGTHVVKIRVVGTSSHPRVDVDGFLVVRDN